VSVTSQDWFPGRFICLFTHSQSGITRQTPHLRPSPPYNINVSTPSNHAVALGREVPGEAGLLIQLLALVREKPMRMTSFVYLLRFEVVMHILLNDLDPGRPVMATAAAG
jgi:hypothetical protein